MSRSKNKKKHILVVDDDESCLAIMHRTLGKRFDVTTAVSAMCALDFLERYSAARDTRVVVSDYHMSNVNGVEFLSMVKLQYPQIGRIMYSCTSHYSHFADVVDDFILKPAAKRVLEASISRVMNSYDARRERQDE